MFTEFVARMEDTRLPRWRMFGELLGGASRVGRQEREDGVFPGRPQSFRYQCRPVYEWRTEVNQGAERFMAKRIAACGETQGRTTA